MRKKPRRFRPPTPESLAKTALAYLSRFAASESSLRRVLKNRIRKASMLDASFAQDKEVQEKLGQVIEHLIEKHRKNGVLNDTAYAETKVNSLRRAGRSARMITMRLGQAGVDKHVIAHALTGDGGAAEIEAARKLARRRKLGPFREGETLDPAQRKKDLAVLARAGFAFDIARRVLGDHCAGGIGEANIEGEFSDGV